ncbi:hypothetical protein JHK86_011970 [Glycine max]|nr:hypothetical protein JHK86_011970 [Glycine max]
MLNKQITNLVVFTKPNYISSVPHPRHSSSSSKFHNFFEFFSPPLFFFSSRGVTPLTI